MQSQNWTTLPEGLPVPTDDGAAAHLAGMKLPQLALAATTGGTVDLSTQRGRTVVFAYPRTGQPGQPLPTPDWDMIPGALDALRIPAASAISTGNFRRWDARCTASAPRTRPTSAR